MRRLRTPFSTVPGLAWLVTRAAVGNAISHWALAMFSLAAAFGVWFVIQDVENPRVEGRVPVADPAIPIEARNLGGDYIVTDLPLVHVVVNSRKEDLPLLRPSDFEAFVDAKGLSAGARESRQVTVISQRKGVQVISVDPPFVQVSVEQATTRELPVQVRRTGQLPVGYREAEPPVIEPSFVKVRGRATEVNLVNSVDLDVNLSGVREANYVTEGDLVARTENGNTVTVTMTPESRARATFKVEQTYSQRTVAIAPLIVGTPAPGYRVANVIVDPPTALVTGPSTVVEKLQSLGVEQLSVTGARTDITQTRVIDKPPNTLVDRQTVVVKVEIKPLECGGTQAGTACGAATVVVAAEMRDIPLGLTPELGTHTVQVRVSGPVAQIALLKPGDVRATVSLAGATAGLGAYTAVATVDPKFTGVKVDSVDLVFVTLNATAFP